ncbi:MAG: hypothetical protein NVS9B15_09820 [Acidobacteriaceae bacterium]
MLLFPLAAAQSCHDANFESQEPTASLYAASPFLHGYRDGYQQGFHDADMKQQFGHMNSERIDHGKKTAYKREFGDKRSYVTGFTAGFDRGVSDLNAVNNFRIFEILRSAEERLSTSPLRNAEFNAGVMQGYTRAVGPISKDLQDCTRKSSIGFCSGMEFGTQLAKIDETLQVPR